MQDGIHTDRKSCQSHGDLYQELREANKSGKGLDLDASDADGIPMDVKSIRRAVDTAGKTSNVAVCPRPLSVG